MMFSLRWYWTPRYWRKRRVSVSNHVFCTSINISRSVPSGSRTVAAKSMRNIDSESRWLLLYSWGRTSTLMISFFSRAERMVRATRSSSMRNLNTLS